MLVITYPFPSSKKDTCCESLILQVKHASLKSGEMYFKYFKNIKYLEKSLLSLPKCFSFIIFKYEMQKIFLKSVYIVHVFSRLPNSAADDGTKSCAAYDSLNWFFWTCFYRNKIAWSFFEHGVLVHIYSKIKSQIQKMFCWTFMAAFKNNLEPRMSFGGKMKSYRRHRKPDFECKNHCYVYFYN